VRTWRGRQDRRFRVRGRGTRLARWSNAARASCRQSAHARSTNTLADAGATERGSPEPDDNHPRNGGEAEMKRLRYLFLAALAGFAALPVTQVYTSGAPWIQKLEVRNNDLTAVQGKGVPGTAMNVYYRQRNFKEGYWDESVPGVDPFSWCNWLNGG